MHASEVQFLLNIFSEKEDKVALSAVCEACFDLQPTSKWNAVCWVELRCVDKAFSTDTLSGWLTDECVCV